MKPKVLVLFLGNILRGDDGVGIELLKRLSKRDLPETIRLEEGSTGGMILLGLMDGYERVLIVDAVDTTDRSSDVIIFTPDELKKEEQNITSLHSIGIKDVIELGRLLGERTPEIYFFGVQVYETGEHIGLSPPLISKIDNIEDMLYKYILKISQD